MGLSQTAFSAIQHLLPENFHGMRAIISLILYGHIF